MEVKIEYSPVMDRYSIKVNTHDHGRNSLILKPSEMKELMAALKEEGF